MGVNTGCYDVQKCCIPNLPSREGDSFTQEKPKGPQGKVSLYCSKTKMWTQLGDKVNIRLQK